MARRTAILVHPDDSVVTLAEDALAGDTVEYRTSSGEGRSVEAAQDVPLGHKVALVDVPEGGNVMKYGQIIGVAATAIRAGEHVHVHNLRSSAQGGE